MVSCDSRALEALSNRLPPVLSLKCLVSVKLYSDENLFCLKIPDQFIEVGVP